ncbi:MAG TPA: SPOR domain-containing protein [Gemmatimonadaceae bacterium]
MSRQLILLAAALLLAPGATHGQETDTALARIERLIVAGDRSSARTLIDSLVTVLPSDSPQLAEVLYWRAQSSPSAVDAERDYLRIAIDHQFSPRAPEALMALGQLELARGDRIAARRRFDRALRDYPSGRHVPRASLWSGRLALEERDYAAGCATLAAARPLVTDANVELRNQIDYYLAQCERAQPATGADPTTLTPPAPPGAAFSVQVAAYSTRRDASALHARLRARGYDVRIVGEGAPFRVRIGRYATRADAMSALNRLRAQGLTGIVVEAERP